MMRRSVTIECSKCGARNTFHLRPTQHTVKLTCRDVGCEEMFKVTIEAQSSIRKGTLDRFGRRQGAELHLSRIVSGPTLRRDGCCFFHGALPRFFFNSSPST